MNKSQRDQQQQEERKKKRRKREGNEERNNEKQQTSFHFDVFFFFLFFCSCCCCSSCFCLFPIFRCIQFVFVHFFLIFLSVPLSFESSYLPFNNASFCPNACLLTHVRKRVNRNKFTWGIHAHAQKECN
ncbi:hypothetical protein, unlikely [Trypanosoma brucei brucei TREU927]|uniref:Uncharacterized protein n=1 Tax=Trypanosoma brucei brucei (strain 927/4 GUTat10.1) TaxID=185431 RepID=Q38DH0_TRYB2|nr:hypothetical protein, unlikely [Trypanosoma brucei brucei TREU927]EAN77150.1 hypothetical protein, unlikely [Trypanosoma brucei brucei TREU927]